jgi:hypothetical protein
MVLCHSRRSLLSLLLLCLIAGCSGTPVTTPKSSQAKSSQANSSKASTVAPAAPQAPVVAKTPTFVAAQRFMNSWGAGDLIQTVMQREMEKNAAEQPGVAELMKRVFANTSKDEFTDLAASVYARHVNQADLESLATFSETPTGNRFFKSVVGAVLATGKVDPNTLTRQFNANELTEIYKFSQSPSFLAMQAQLPLINKEMGEEGRKFGERKLKEYMKRN